MCRFESPLVLTLGVFVLLQDKSYLIAKMSRFERIDNAELNSIHLNMVRWIELSRDRRVLIRDFVFVPRCCTFSILLWRAAAVPSGSTTCSDPS